MAFTWKGHRITQKFSSLLTLPWRRDDLQHCPSSPAVYGTPAASPEEKWPSADRIRLCCGQTATERRGRRASSPCCPNNTHTRADMSAVVMTWRSTGGVPLAGSCQQHWGLRVQVMQAVPLLQLPVSKPNYRTCTEQQDRTQHFEWLLNKQEVITTFSPRTPDRTLLNSCIWPPTPSRRPRWTQRVRI